MANFIPLNIYGIGIYHPSDWRIFVNPNNKFSFDEGLIKIDKVIVNKKAASSLQIRWAKMKEDIGLDKYVDELEKQFKKKEKRSRNKDKYRITEKKKCMVNGRDAYLLENEFIANHSIYRVLGKDELVKVLQMMFYSEDSGRMVVASLSASTEEMRKNKDLYIEILSSLYEDTHGTLNSNHEEEPQKKIRLA